MSALFTAGCGSQTSSRSIPGAAPGLVQALGVVRDSSYARAYFEWSDLAAVRKLAGLPAGANQPLNENRRWGNVFGVGTDGLALYEPVITTKAGIDFLRADRGIKVGMPPNVALRVDGPGVDGAAVARKLTALGAKRESAGGRTFLAMGAPHSINLGSPLAQAGVLNQLDRVVASGHTVAAGSADPPVEAVLGGGRSLASDAAFRAAAGCLGDVIVAAIVPASSVQAGPAADLVAVGDRRPSSATAPVTEVLCAVDEGASVAKRQAAAMRRALGASGRIPELGAASSLVRSLTVSQVKSGNLIAVRGIVSLKPAVNAGVLYHVLYEGHIGSLLGSQVQP